MKTLKIIKRTLVMLAIADAVTGQAAGAIVQEEAIDWSLLGTLIKFDVRK
jgi:hypothetical protein